jgi:Mn-containing catalase
MDRRVPAHAYGLALKQLTGVDMTKMLPVPNIATDKFPEARRYLQEGSHRRLYRFSPKDYAEIGAIWGNGEQALPGDPPGKLEVVDGHPDGGKIPELAGISAAFTPDYQPEEIFEIANNLYGAFKG